MPHIFNANRNNPDAIIPGEEDIPAIMNELRWTYVKRGISDEDLYTYFDFLDKGVVIRSGAEGIPMMTTTGIYGPIFPGEFVSLQQGVHKVVNRLLAENHEGETLLEELKLRRAEAEVPGDDYSIIVQAKWVSGKDGGGLPNVGSSSNVFGATGSLLVNETDLDFPVIEYTDPNFDKTLQFYGAKLLQPGEAFNIGYDKPIFGMEYDTRLPGYIQDYVMQDWGGGGLFVEHHPFPHIWFPNPTEDEKSTNICRILLGRIVESELDQIVDDLESAVDVDVCPDRLPKDPKKPEYHFTVFRFPSDQGYALAVDECCIHNDSFCNGKQVVFLADTDANTVALRETAPFKNLRISEKEIPYLKKD
jgi:catechol 2,3-dioxygenase-like lactoylglutathione lyase family enzyme